MTAKLQQIRLLRLLFSASLGCATLFGQTCSDCIPTSTPQQPTLQGCMSILQI